MDRIYVMQLVRSFQCGEIDRRLFLKRATAALGSVAAANVLLAGCTPIPAEPPPPVVEESAEEATESDAAPADGSGAEVGLVAGLIAHMVDYPSTSGETVMGYLARPEDSTPAPIVIVIQEWWGLNEHIKDVTRRFASEGFIALAPDLYHGVVVTEPNEARKLVMELDMGAAVQEIQDGIAFLQGQEYVSGPSAGVVGFCMGGRLSLATALVQEDLGAAIAFYGSPLAPEQVTDLKAPVLGLYGSEDRGIPVDAVNAMGNALNEAGIENEIHIYDGAPHAFFNDTSASYRAEAAEDAWGKTLDWFRRHL